MCCFKSDELQFLNIFCANRVAILCSVGPNKLDLLNYITETLHVTEGRILVSHVAENLICSINSFHFCIRWSAVLDVFHMWYLECFVLASALLRTLFC